MYYSISLRDYDTITIFLPPVFPPATYSSLLSFKINDFSFHCYYMCIRICIHIYIFKYNLFGLYNVVCTMISGVTIWINNWYVLTWRILFISLWKFLSSLKFLEASRHVYWFILVRLLCRQSYWRDVMGVASDVSRGHSLTAHSPIFWLLTIPPPLPQMFPKPLIQKCSLYVSVRTGLWNSIFIGLVILLFCNDLYLLQRVYLVKDEDCI